MKFLTLSRDLFFSQYFEKDFYFEKKAIGLNELTWDDVDEMLFGWSPNDGSIHLFKDGKIDPISYTEDFYDVGMLRKRIIKDSFNNLMLNGATLVLNRIDTKSTKINKLTKAISHFVKEKAVANGYIAFGGNGTFAKHWDTHDVFAIQLIGRKQWKLFAPTFNLPLQNQTSKERKHECPETPVFDEILEAGDILYIPRGWWHEALPIEQEETFHIAVGVHTAHITDYLTWCSGNCFVNDLNFRKSITTQPIEKFTETNVLDVLNNIQNINRFKAAQGEQDKVISPFILSHISKKIKKTKDEKNGILFLNTSYSTSIFENNLLINGVKINIDKKSKIIFDLIEDNLLTKDELVKIVCKDNTNEDKLREFINVLIFNDVICEI
ncbi:MULTISPECIES: JmjC domain-containing protein [Acinetobacter calcoaceticus/baumannii complex]|uniref:JmjC domain-containing protein n=1 Tax=Acinetobacter pittii ANC 4050 TaxID=1217691 RepID=R8YI73_ACIPI|nr:cupin domain-containing protein [Acinetobacter pittii]EOQ67167.1 hypothetical protein F931_02200 [Acinetobacter pittii ANC 4050]